MFGSGNVRLVLKLRARQLGQDVCQTRHAHALFTFDAERLSCIQGFQGKVLLACATTVRCLLDQSSRTWSLKEALMPQSSLIEDLPATICDDWSHKFIRKTRETPQIATTGVDVSHFVLEMILISIIIMSFHGGSICFRELSQGKLLQTLSQSHRH